MILEKDVLAALSNVIEPELGANLVELGMIKDIEIDGEKVSFTLVLTIPECPLVEYIVSQAREAVLALDGVKEVNVKTTSIAEEERINARSDSSVDEKNSTVKGYGNTNEIKHVIAVMSGKGGVGKSLVSALLAASLRREGKRVGILDADITGPSIPKIFGIKGYSAIMGPSGILPAMTKSGIELMSVNLLLQEETSPVIWRGPLISNAIQQFWKEVMWERLDFLILDLSPGTSDAALTVLQSIPLSGVVLVSSPQDLSGMVVKKAASMCKMLKIPILGLIENMSYFKCPDCGKEHNIFGKSQGEEMSKEIETIFLGRLPIDPEISRLCDEGKIESYALGEMKQIATYLLSITPSPSLSEIQSKDKE